ncbi:MAG: phosphate acyltransferase PlsX [Tissierellia bacterium]|nr:phosphate acyltransferase PlsX [Tissierellia bacterium]
MKIIVDGMGGDNAPESTVRGSIEAIKEHDIEIIITGPTELLERELSKYDYPKNKITILHASETIENTDNPTIAIRKKKDSSLVVALKAMTENKGDGVISAGNTGALLAGGLFIVKRIDGIDRAALTVIYPTTKGASLLVDAGANMDSKPEYLEQFAIMGSIYVENVMNIKNPKIGLVNVGTEDEKGNQLTKDAYPLIKKRDVNFVGNVEARDLPDGIVDVIVCDGFVGNIILKLTEGMAKSIFTLLKKTFVKNAKTKLGAMLLKPEILKLKEMFDYREYGGAPLLGTKQPIVKAHGSSDYYAFKNGIIHLITFIEKDVISIIETNFK